MATAVVEFDEQTELAEAPEELRITEAAGVVEPSLCEGILARASARGIELREGEELLQIIRPCVGRGRGTREYRAEMLEPDAPNWSGARMFRNHLTEKERKQLGGLPRPIEHLAGRIRESWWDGEVPPSPDGSFDRGGVYAVVKPTRFIREMVDDDPDLIEASINALATGLRPERRDGRVVQVVEGIRETPRSVDWVTEGGAGGRVLRESAHEQEEAVLESLRDEEIEEYLARERPGLLEALSTANDPDGDGDDDSAEIEARAKKHIAKGKSRKEALALARQEIADQAGSETTEGAAMPEGITSEALIEALADGDTRDAVVTALREHITVEPEGFVRADEVETLVESALAEKADLIRIEARGDLERQIELRDMRDRATELIESAKLHPRLAARIKDQFALSETGEPTETLASIQAEYDSDGNLVKGALDSLVEAVHNEIADAREIMGDLRPTRVRGAGRDARLTESVRPSGDGGAEGEGGTSKGKQTTGSSLADELLEGAGFSREDLPNLWVTD